jgi:colanic acid biosynthesis glycosyl transferase WcaI
VKGGAGVAGVQGNERRIVMIMQFFDPEPVYKGQEFAQAIAAHGFDVEVVTGFPNYPGGKLYAGYKIRPWARSKKDGITITRVPLYPSHDSSKVGRVLNYLSFAFSAAIYVTLFGNRPSLIYAYHPPVTVGLAGAVASFFRRSRFVLDIHDLWPDTLPATGMIKNRRVLGLVDRTCSWLYHRTDHIILHSNGFLEALKRRGVPADKMTAVIGWAGSEAPPSGVRNPISEMEGARGLKVLFAGNMGPAQALSTVLRAALVLRERNQQDAATFFLLGSGVETDSLKTEAQRLDLKGVVFLPRVPPSRVSDYLAAADVLLVHLKDLPLFRMTMPSKTQTYMLAGRPILMAVEGEAAELISSIDAGITATPEDPESLAEAVLRFADLTPDERARMGANAQEHYWSHLSMARGVGRFVAIFKRVTAEP